MNRPYMTESRADAASIELLRKAYAAFDRHEFETVIALMHPEVDWPNAWEGGMLRGPNAVRDYWKRQFAVLDSRLETLSFNPEADGRIAIEVRQIVHDKDGKLVADRVVQHVYRIEDGLIRGMEVRS